VDQEAWLSAISTGGGFIEYLLLLWIDRYLLFDSLGKFMDEQEDKSNKELFSSIFDDRILIDDIDGNKFNLSSLKGKVCLIVNVASR